MHFRTTIYQNSKKQNKKHFLPLRKKHIDKHFAKFQQFALRLKIMRSQVRNGVLLYIVVLLNRSRRLLSHVRHAILSFISLLGLTSETQEKSFSSCFPEDVMGARQNGVKILADKILLYFLPLLIF